jgi:hypothetical protein
VPQRRGLPLDFSGPVCDNIRSPCYVYRAVFHSASLWLIEQAMRARAEADELRRQLADAAAVRRRLVATAVKLCRELEQLHRLPPGVVRDRSGRLLALSLQDVPQAPSVRWTPCCQDGTTAARASATEAPPRPPLKPQN